LGAQLQQQPDVLRGWLYVLPEEYDQYLSHVLLAVQGSKSLQLADYSMD